MISSSVRKSLGCILLGCMVFLYGCGSSGAAGGTVNETAGTAAGVQNETQTVSGDGETEPENGDADGPSYSQNGRQFEILEVKEKYLLVSAVDTAYGLYTAGHGPVLEDEDECDSGVGFGTGHDRGAYMERDGTGELSGAVFL